MGFSSQERRESPPAQPRILPSELLQARERVRGKRLPLFVIRRDEKNERIARMWKIPGTSVRVSGEGDIYYPV